MRPSPPLSTSEQEFPYGWRYVKRTGPDSGEEFDRVPLTLEDVLHPQEGDVIPGNLIHDADCTYLATVFRSRQFGPPVVLVTHDILIDWGVEGIRNHSPDVAVFVGLDHAPPPRAGLIGVRDLNGRCELAIEVVSPSTRSNDVVAKVEHYYRVGIPLYFIIDQPTEDGPRSLIAYRRGEMGYVRMRADESECVDVPLLGLKIGMHEDRVACYDRRTGRELGDYTGIARRLEELELRDEQQQQVIEEQNLEIEEQVAARQEAERNAKEAERLADRQRKEREEAERKADDAQKLADQQRAEAERAQKEADKQRQEADRAQKEAEKERRAREEADKAKQFAQEQADQRIRGLEELVRRLQGTSAGDAAG